MSTVHSLQGLGGRLLTERRGRTGLTVAGIMLGVALFTGCLLATTTATAGLERFAAEANGQADVIASPPGGSLISIVTPAGGDLDADVVDSVSVLPDVEAAAGLFAVPSAFEGPGGSTEVRLNQLVAAGLVGLDFEAARPVFPLDVDRGRLPTPGADEIALGPKVANRIGADVGDPVTVPTAEGQQRATLVGVLAERGIGRLDRVGFTSTETVHRWSGRSDVVSQIGIELADGVDAAAWIEAHQGEVPDGVALLTTAESLETFREQINAFTGALTAIGLGLLFAAAFLIYLTLSMSVVERTRLYGTMIALGATRRQIRRVVLAEALVIGTAGTAVGLVVGVGVAELLRLAASRLLGLFGSPDLEISPWVLLLSAAVGMTVSVVSAFIPARRAARTDPTAAIRASEADEPVGSGSWLLALILLAVGGAALEFGFFPVPGIDIILVGIGAVRLVPFLVRPIARRIGPVLARLSPGGGRIAVQHLAAERTRSAYTLALVMIVMTMAVAITAIFLSFNRSLERQLTEQFGDDLQISAASNLSPEFLDQVIDVPGVAGITTRSKSSATLLLPDGAEDVRIDTIDPATYFDVASFPFSSGDASDVVEAFSTGPALILPAATAERIGVDQGDSVVMQTLQGPVDFTVAATAALQNIPPALIVSSQVGESLFGAFDTESALVRIDPAFEPESVKTTIESELAGQGTFIVTTSSELKADTREQIGAGINGFFVLLLLAGVVGTFGLANTMAVSVYKRYREIGVLRAIGARRRQIQAMAIIESLTLVAVALVLALPLGIALSRPLLDTTREQLGDLTIHYETPWIIVPILAVVGAMVAVLAAIWPARRASQLEIDTALRFE